MGKKHKNKVRVLPGRMYRLVRSDRSVYCDAENALRTCLDRKSTRLNSSH